MTTTPDRAAGLRAARAKDSADKRRRALEAIHALEAAGSPITATAIAHAAGVSTWLLYTDGLREHLDTARHRQAQPDSGPPRTATPGDQAPLTPTSLRTDLALARAEIRRLRADNDKLRHRLWEVDESEPSRRSNSAIRADRTSICPVSVSICTACVLITSRRRCSSSAARCSPPAARRSAPHQTTPRPGHPTMITDPARRSSRHANNRPNQARSDQAPSRGS